MAKEPGRHVCGITDMCGINEATASGIHYAVILMPDPCQIR